MITKRDIILAGLIFIIGALILCNVRHESMIMDMKYEIMVLRENCSHDK